MQHFHFPTTKSTFLHNFHHKQPQPNPNHHPLSEGQPPAVNHPSTTSTTTKREHTHAKCLPKCIDRLRKPECMSAFAQPENRTRISSGELQACSTQAVPVNGLKENLVVRRLCIGENSFVGSVAGVGKV